MVKVLQVSASVSPLHGGPSEMALNLNRAMRAQGHAIQLLTSDNRLGPDEVRRLKAEFPLGTLQLTSSRHHLAEPVRWARWLSGALSDRSIVHIHGFYLWQTALAAMLSRAKRVPYVVHCHGTFEPYQTQQSRWRKAVFDWIIGRRILRDAAGMVFDTEAESDIATLPRGVPRKRTYVVPPCPANDMVPNSKSRGLDPGAPVILFLARIAPVKRVDLVISAMPAILRIHPNALLLVAGLDSENLASHAIASLPQEAQRAIVLEGFTTGSAKKELFRRAHVYVLPSENENFGISVAEALTEGVPVVISEAVGVAAYVKAAGAGVVLRDPTASSIADAVSSVLSDPEGYWSMSQSARDLGHRLYSAETTVELANQAYVSVIRSSRATAVTNCEPRV